MSGFLSIINQLKFEIDNLNIHRAKPVLRFKIYTTHVESLHSLIANIKHRPLNSPVDAPALSLIT